MNQPFAESHFADDQTAVVVLDCAGDDFCGRCSQPIYQHYNRVILAAIAVLSYIALLGRGAAVVRDDELSLLQEFVGYSDPFAQQAARIPAQIEDQTFQIAK